MGATPTGARSPRSAITASNAGPGGVLRRGRLRPDPDLLDGGFSREQLRDGPLAHLRQGHSVQGLYQCLGPLPGQQVGGGVAPRAEAQPVQHMQHRIDRINRPNWIDWVGWAGHQVGTSLLALLARHVNCAVINAGVCASTS